MSRQILKIYFFVLMVVILINIDLKYTSGFATTHVVDFLWVCKTSYHLLISPPPTNLPNSLPAPYHSPSIPVKDSHWRETLIKLTARVECGASIHAIFQLTVRRIRMFFSLKPSSSQGVSSLKISARWGSPFRRS